VNHKLSWAPTKALAIANQPVWVQTGKSSDLFHHLVKALSFRNFHASSVVLLFFFFDK
jgi:hypothetical protein